jgi:endonuclease/exonuclease/phosphatase family metal-dependent hydrolase
MLLLVLVIAALPAALRAEDRPLRLVTFNVMHGGPWSTFTGEDGRLEARLAMIIERLRALDADVIALQESPVTRRRGDVAARIAVALGLHHVHARATERVFPVRVLGRLIVGALGFVEGPAVLSRFPIVHSEVHDLPRCRRWLDPRVVLRADVRTPAGVLAVFSTHTSRDDCQTRRVAEVAAGAGGPAVVMGDLNTVDSAPAFAAFREQGFVDAFRTANPAEPGLTVWQRIEVAEPTVFRRVDYVLLRAGDGLGTEVVASRVVLDSPGRSEEGRALWPSDHYGVLAEVRLAPRSAAGGGEVRPTSAR